MTCNLQPARSSTRYTRRDRCAVGQKVARVQDDPVAGRESGPHLGRERAAVAQPNGAAAGDAVLDDECGPIVAGPKHGAHRHE